MGPALKERLREGAKEDLPKTYHPIYGIIASGNGRFHNVFFYRDAAIATILCLSKPRNCEDFPDVIDAAIQSNNAVAKLQGEKFDPNTEETPGGIVHEYHDQYSPQQRLIELKENGWPVYKNPDGSLGLKVYTAGDTPPLFILSVAAVARALELRSSDQAAKYQQRIWPFVKKALDNGMYIADYDGDGLIESIPQNKNTLLNHTWKDSNDAYRAENGRIPKPPYKYLNNNSYHLWSLKEAALMADNLGMGQFASELRERYIRGVEIVHNLFWMDDEQFFAPLIDGKGRQVKFIGDDVLEGLWGKVFKPDYAARVIERLKRPDMNTLWGLRTRSDLSTQFRVNGGRAYHNGLIWPHRQAIAAEGLENYGDFTFAEEIDDKRAALELRKGRVECVAEDRIGRLIGYMEKKILVACQPQTWAVYGDIART